MRITRKIFVILNILLLLYSGFAFAASPDQRVSYQPSASFKLNVFDVNFRVTDRGRQLMARVYQPVGSGPFPVLLDLHGGAWNKKDRLAEAPMDQAIAASGVLVVAIDLTRASESPYPSAIQDASYGVRWVKARAHEWGGDPGTLGLYGSSSGGHIAELLGMMPNDPLYNADADKEFKNLNTLVRYVVTRSPISNTEARYENAVNRQRESMINNNLNFFKPWEAISLANPQRILDQKRFTRLPPLLIMQGEKDDNVLPKDQEHFARSYQQAGGQCQYVVFKDSEHEWVAKEGEQTTQARELVKEFIVKQLLTTRPESLI